MISANRLFPRLVLLGALTAALAVGACGRKGALDAPPGGAASVSQTDQPAQTGQATQALQPAQQNSQTGNNLISRGGPGGLPVVRGEDKRIPLDVLLN